MYEGVRHSFVPALKGAHPAALYLASTPVDGGADLRVYPLKGKPCYALDACREPSIYFVITQR
jgi:hypothetical protein